MPSPADGRAIDPIRSACRPSLDDGALFEHDDLVGVANRAESVGNDQAGGAAVPDRGVDVRPVAASRADVASSMMIRAGSRTSAWQSPGVAVDPG